MTSLRMGVSTLNLMGDFRQKRETKFILHGKNKLGKPGSIVHCKKSVNYWKLVTGFDLIMTSNLPTTVLVEMSHELALWKFLWKRRLGEANYLQAAVLQ